MKINFNTVLISRKKNITEPIIGNEFKPEYRGFPIIGVKDRTLGSASIEALSSPNPEHAQKLTGQQVFDRNKLADKIFNSMDSGNGILEVDTDLSLLKEVIGLKFKTNGGLIGATWKLLEDK